VKLIFNFKATPCVDSSKILKPVPGGRDWRGKEKKVMQLLGGRRCTAVVVDGKMRFYGKAGLAEPQRQV
jgi:hypothetical protein